MDIGIQINQINLDTEAPMWVLVTIVVRLAIYVRPAL